MSGFLGMVVKAVLFVLLITLALATVFIAIDANKKRKLTKYPFISFIIPSYNDAKMIEGTIKSIYDNYPNNKFELFAINDNSTDNTAEILNKLKSKYKISVITNKKNIGKSNSINNVSGKAKGDIIFIVDSDVHVNKDAFYDLLARFEYNKKLGGASCRYKPLNEGDNFLTLMQGIEYNMLSFIQGAYNIFSTISM